MLTGIFTPTTCARCRLCCNFHRSTAWETPALEPAAATLLRGLGVPLATRPNGALTFRLDFRTHDPEEVCNCPMLDTASGCRLPREQRPFECRVWPLRVMRDSGGSLVIGCYDACPALTPDTRARLEQHATGALLPELLRFAEETPLSVREMDPAYTVIWRKE